MAAAAAATSSPSTFPHFPSLPPELRNLIWRAALPDKDGPALYPYRYGCCCLRRLSKSDANYDPDDRYNSNLEFCYDSLEVQVEVQLVFVNREARGIALGWVREQRIEMRFCEDRQCHVFVRPFDPTRNVLYIACHRLRDFIAEPWERIISPLDHLRQMPSIDLDLTRIAVPEAMLWNDDSITLFEMFEVYVRPAVLFIIVDAPPDLEEDNDVKVQRRWEVESTQGKRAFFFWNRDHGRFDLRDGEYIGGEALYRRIEEASKKLSEWLADSHVCSFEIRPVFAVRK